MSKKRYVMAALLLTWASCGLAALISLEGYDLRGASLSVTPAG